MLIRKTLSFTVAAIMLISSLPRVSAEYVDSDHTPPLKIQKLIKLESKLTPYLESQINKRIQTIADKRLKRQYLAEIALKKEDLKSFFSQLEYSYSDDEYAEKFTELKERVIEIRDLIVEAEKAQAEGVNPYDISGADTTKVESRVLTTQKDITSYLRTILQVYEGKSMKQENPSRIHFEGDIGTVDVQMEKYTSILSWATGNQELDLTMNAQADLKIPSGEFDASGKYITKTKSLKGSLKLDGNMKVIDQDTYFLIRDYQLDVTSDGKAMTEELKEIKTTLDALKGKSIHIAMPKGYEGQIDSRKIIASAKSILDILETNPLLTPYKKIGETYTLEPKRETIDLIAKKIGAETLTDESFINLRKEFRETPILFAEKDGGYDFWVNIKHSDTTGELRLRVLSGNYTFTTTLQSMKGDTFSSELRRGYFKLDAKSKDGNANILWNNNVLKVEASSQGQTLAINGPLSHTNADLTLVLNGKTIGTIKVTGTETHSEFDIMFNMEIPSPWKASWKGTVDISHGDYPINKPSSSIELQDALPKQSKDSTGSAIDFGGL